MSAPDLIYESIGLGVQSWTMFVMGCRGLHNVPKPHCAIFADTGDEIVDTYRMLEYAETFGKTYGVPLHVVSVGTSLAAAAAVSGIRRLNGNKFFVSLPIYVVEEHPVPGWQECEMCLNAFKKSGQQPTLGMGTVRHVGMLRRQCTNEFKLVPIRKKVRELLGLDSGERAGDKRAVALIGISLDEAIRMKPSRDAYIENTYPLVEARLTRLDCVKFLKENALPVPVKSACRFCPYHDDRYWDWLKRKRPGEFEQSCQFDEMIRDLSKAGVRGVGFIHKALKPLREVEFDLNEEPNQGRLFAMAGGFANECEGMCGL